MIVGGIIPDADAGRSRPGVAAVFTPKDFGLNDIMGQFVTIIRRPAASTIRGQSRLAWRPA